MKIGAPKSAARLNRKVFKKTKQPHSLKTFSVWCNMYDVRIVFSVYYANGK